MLCNQPSDSYRLLVLPGVSVCLSASICCLFVLNCKIIEAGAFCVCCTWEAWRAEVPIWIQALHLVTGDFCFMAAGWVGCLGKSPPCRKGQVLVTSQQIMNESEISASNQQISSGRIAQVSHGQRFSSLLPKKETKISSYRWMGDTTVTTKKS